MPGKALFRQEITRVLELQPTHVTTMARALWTQTIGQIRNKQRTAYIHKSKENKHIRSRLSVLNKLTANVMKQRLLIHVLAFRQVAFLRQGCVWICSLT